MNQRSEAGLLCIQARAEPGLGSSPVDVKPPAASLICLGTHMHYGFLCLLLTDSRLSEKNTLVLGHFPIKLLHIKQGSSLSDSFSSYTEAEKLGGLTTFGSAILDYLGGLIRSFFWLTPVFQQQ